MHSSLRFILICCSILGFSGLTNGQISETEKNKLSFSALTEVNTRYIWRGYTFSEGLVFQPSASASFRNFNISIWTNFDLDKNPESPAFNEYDIVFSYTYERDRLEIQPVIQFYIYPGTEDPSTGELALNAVYNFRNLKFLTSQNVDFINYKGAYFGNAGVGFENEIYGNVFFNCGVNLGWSNSKFNETYGETKINALNNVSCNFGLTYYPSEIIYAGARFELSSLLDKNLREMFPGQPIINWGFSLGVEL